MAGRESNSTIITTVGLFIVIIVIVVMLVRSKHSNTPLQSPSPAQTSAIKQQVEKNWKTFFASSTSLQAREELLQNGNKFSQPIRSEFAALSSQASSAKISSINLVNSSSANVVYTVDLNGQAVLSDQKGSALLLNNTWKVSDTTLCGLLSLGGSNPAACKNL